MTTTLHIKNMVCPRCIRAVTDCLTRLGLHPLSVELGIAQIKEDDIDDALRIRLRQTLEAEGFELLEAPRARLVEQIKDAVIRLVHYREAAPSANLSRYLSELLHKDYSTLSKAFSEETGTTIERYAIVQKIERVKELLTYDELTLNEIADRLGYSSAAYLSTQFKQITGLTPSAFKRSEGRTLSLSAPCNFHSRSQQPVRRRRQHHPVQPGHVLQRGRMPTHAPDGQQTAGCYFGTHFLV